jgi:hypothetical protein
VLGYHEPPCGLEGDFYAEKRLFRV